MTIQYYIRRPNRGAVVSTKLTDLSAELTEFIKDQAPGAKAAAAQAAADYLVGDGRHGLRHYPSYKYVTRRRAYGKPFFSDRQRRYVMARIREGSIDPGVPHRTGNLQRGWKTKGVAGGVMIYNDQPHVLPVMGDVTQSRHERLVGWRMISPIIESNMTGALQAAQRAAVKYIKEKA